MRKAFATLALALAGSASAAVIAVDTGHESPTAIERAAAPELIKRDGDSTSTSTSTTTRTSTVWDTVTVWMKPSSTGSSTSSSTSPSIVKQQNVAFAAADETITMVETITATVVAQPVVTVYVNPSSAGTLFGEKAKAVDDTSDIHHPDELVAPHVKRNAVDERGMEFASMIVTQFTTSTIPGTTVTSVVTGSPPPEASGMVYSTVAPVNQAPAPSSSTAAIASSSTTAGVAVVSVTTYVTVTMISATSPTLSTTTCTNSTSSTSTSTSWPSINMSTFSATGLNLTTTSSGLLTASGSSVFAYTTSTSSNNDGIMGFTGAVTSKLGTSGSSKMVDLEGLHVPMGVVVAMGACFALALML